MISIHPPAGRVYHHPPSSKSAEGRVHNSCSMMLPDASPKASQDLGLLAGARREDSRSNSKSRAAPNEEWIYVPPEGRLKIERHGHSATVHIWPSIQESAFSSADADERDATHDESASQQSGTANMITNAALPMPRLPTEIPVLEEYHVSAMCSADPNPFNPFHEPSPLGLTLRKTPSLLDLIQMKLGHNDAAMSRNHDVQTTESSSRGRKSSTSSTVHQDKLKASNFPASILKVGTWERVSRHEGDLVAKCYYAKKKLVWEVLENRLKSKIEIQWSDITALKASCLESKPGILEIQVSRPPLFFKETNPQPRKHTLWQATSDFTGGQATVCKVHFLKFCPGLLNRHYDKLMQCDPRLKSLSEKILLSEDYDSLESHDEKVVQNDKRKNIQQDPKYHSVQFDNEHIHPYPSLHAILGSDSLQHAGVVSKHEPVELDDRMWEFTTGSSSASSGIDSQGHDESIHTSTRERFHSSGHTVSGAKPEYQFYGTARNQCLDQFSELTNVQASYLCPSFLSSDNKRHLLDEVACNFHEEPPLQAFNDQTNRAGLKLLSSFQVDIKDRISLPVSHVLTSSLFSETQACSRISFQECTKNKQRQPNENMGGIALGGKRLLPEEMIKNSFEPSMFRIKRKPSVDLLFSIPQIPVLPQFYDHALHGLARCPEPPRCSDAEYN